MARKLSDDEANSLGLDEGSSSAPRKLSDDEIGKLGLESKSGVGETLVHQGLHGLTQGFSDELGGAGTALMQGATNLLPKTVADELDLSQGNAGEAYRFSRDEERKKLEKEKEDNPTLATGANLAGSLVGGLALPVGRVGSGIAGAIGSGALTGAGYGALNGLGNSDADLTKGDVAGAASDTAKGAALGAGLGAGVGAAGGLINAGTSAIAGKANSKVADALANARELAAKNVDEQAGKLRGQLGAETQKGSRQIENIIRAIQSGDATQDQLAAVKALKDSGDWGEVVEGITQRNLDELPGQLNTIGAKKAALNDFMAGKDQAAETEAQRLTSPDEALRQLGERAKRYLPRAAGGVAAKVLGSEEGSGLVGGQILGPMMHSLKRGINSPSVQTSIYKPLGKVASLATTNPARLGKYAGVISSSLERGPQAFAATNFVLQQRDPQYAKLVQDVHSEPEDQ